MAATSISGQAGPGRPGPDRSAAVATPGAPAAKSGARASGPGRPWSVRSWIAPPAEQTAIPWTWWWAGFVAAVVLTVPAWAVWLDPQIHLWKVDDSKNHMLRLFQLGWLLGHGVWFPRLVPDMFMGYGYPLFNFYAPSTYYLAWTMQQVFGLDVWDAYRSVGAIAAVLGAGGIYGLTVAVWRRVSLGILAAVAVLYGPYVFQSNLLYRGDLPEALGLAILPWLLMSIWQLWHTQSRRGGATWIGTSASAGALLLLTHNLTALSAATVAAVWSVYLLVASPSRAALLRLALAGGLALGVTAFFWMPAVGESNLVHLDELWGTGGLDYKAWFISVDGRTDKQGASINRQSRDGLFDRHLRYPHQIAVPPRLSLAQVGLGLLALASLFWTRPRLKTPATALMALALVCWYLTFNVSMPVWQVVTPLTLLQFPWRLHGPIGIAIALSGAGALAVPLGAMSRRWGRPGGLAGLALVTVLGGAVVYNSTGNHAYETIEEPVRTVDGRRVVEDEVLDVTGVGTTSNREFLSRDVNVAIYTIGSQRMRAAFERLYPEAEWLGGSLEPISGDLRFLSWRTLPLRFSVRVANDSTGTAQIGIRQARFAGWRAWVDGRRTEVGTAPYIPEQQAALGFIVIKVPPGEHTIDVAFGPTNLRLVATAITLVTLITCAGLLTWLVWRQGKLVQLAAVPGCLALTLILAYLGWRAVRPSFGRFAALPLPPAQASGGVWQAPDLSMDGAGLLVNLAEAIRTGQGRIDSPSGTALGRDRFVDTRQLTVTDHDYERGLAGTSRRDWLYLHPPSSASVDLAVPAGRQVWFQSSVSLDPQTWTAPVGDGVRFQATITRLGPSGASGRDEPAVVILDLTVNPRARTEQRRWIPVEADLSHWGGSVVRLTLRTLPVDDPSFDWAGWANPVVTVRESARDRPPVGSDG